MEKAQKNISLFKAATWIAEVIVLSKIAGFARDVVIANYYGAGLVSDAYFYAYQIPALIIVILGGVGGPFHSATVAIFSKLIKNYEDKPDKDIKDLFNTFETVAVIIFLLLSLLCFIFPEQIMSIIISAGSPELLQLASTHLKIMSPMILCGSIIGIYYGILVTYKKFMLPNISPAFLSLSIIITLLIFKADTNGVHLAVGTMLGGLVQLLAQVPAVRKLGYSFAITLSKIRDANFKDITELVLPAFLSSTIGQFGLYVDMFFSSGLEGGAWTSLGYANRIFQFPTGLLLTAVLVPLFPLFSKLVGEKKFDDVANYFYKGVGSLFFLSGFLTLIIAIVKVDAIHLALERGAFSHEATLIVANILMILSFSLIFYVFRDSATRLLYSFNDSKIPFWTALLAIILKIFFNSILVKKFGIYGITLSTTLITAINAIILGSFIKTKLEFKYTPLFKTLGKIIVCSIITFAISNVLYKEICEILSWSLINGFLRLLIIGIFSSALYFGISLLFKIEFAKEFLDKILDKVKLCKKVE